MDLYNQTQTYLMNLPNIQAWPEVQILLNQFNKQRPRHWQLPVSACQAVGGMDVQALPGMAAVACLYISIVLIDDMLDADPKGKYHQLGQPATANLSVAFQAAGLEAITQSEHPLSIKLPVLERLNRMILETALGQHWDIQNSQTEEDYWRVMHTKSAPFFGACLQVGALMGGASERTAMQMNELGCLYGEIVQIHDDLSDVMEAPANPDWTLGRSPLPILYAQIVPHAERNRFIELRQAIPDPSALAEAQTILIQCGAISYAVDQLLRRYLKAQTVLTALPLSYPEPLKALFDAAVAPVQELFATLGVIQPNAILSFIPPYLALGE